MSEAVDGEWEAARGHSIAALRYGVMSRPFPSKPPKQQPQTEEDFRQAAWQAAFERMQSESEFV